MVNPQQSDSTRNAPSAQTEPAPTPHPAVPQNESSRVLSANGTTIGRVDSAHPLQRVEGDQQADDHRILPELKHYPELDAQRESGSPTEGSIEDSNHPAELPSPDLADEFDEETALLIQASKIARNVRTRSAEIAAREQRVNELQSRLEQQQQQAAAQEAELQSRNTDLARRIGEFAERRQELEARFTELDQAFAELNEERSKIRSELQAELTSEFNRLERERVEFRENVQQHSQEHKAAIASVRQTLEAERQQLKGQLDSEMQRRVGELQADRQRWESDWKQELGRVEEYRKSAESEIESLKQDLTEREAALIAQQQKSDEARRDLESAHQAFREDQDIVEGFEVRERGIAESQAKLDSERQAMRKEIEADLATQTEELKRQQEAWAQQSAAERSQLEQDRQQMRSEMEADLAGRAENLKRQQEAWAQQSAAERSQLEEDRQRMRSEIEIDLATRITEFDRRQTEWETEYNTAAQALQQREKQLTDRTHQLEKLGGELEEVKQELTTKAAELEDRIHGSRQEIERERREAHESIEAERKSFVDSLDADKLAHDEKLLEERRDFENERDTLRLQMQQHENVLRNRFRFQQEHLQNTRLDLEAAQRRLRHDIQLQRAREGEQLETLRLRRRNLDQYRTLLEERELSLDRERTLLMKSRKSEKVELDRDRAGLASERKAWEHEADAQKAEIRRQQDMLAAHAENLEMRRKRLDALRTELETTHRTTLETRMAVEEAWAQLTQATDPDTARDRVEAARNALTEHYGHLREALTLQRQELEDAQALFQRQKDDFRGERQTLTVWVSERDEKLRMWEERLNKDSSALETSEHKWRSARDNWVHEKLEAESVIRSLLNQITELTRAAGGERELPSQPHTVPPAVSDRADVASIMDPRD